MGLFDSFIKHSPDKVSGAALTPKKVLIVEDEKALLEALVLKFTNKGFTVESAENGQVGLDKAQTFIPDAVVLDLLMPIMDGKTMLHKLRELPQFAKTPVVILTNAGSADNVRETKFYDNANEFFIKSNTSLDAIVSKIKTMIG